MRTKVLVVYQTVHRYGIEQENGNHRWWYAVVVGKTHAGRAPPHVFYCLTHMRPCPRQCKDCKVLRLANNVVSKLFYWLRTPAGARSWTNIKLSKYYTIKEIMIKYIGNNILLLFIIVTRVTIVGVTFFFFAASSFPRVPHLTSGTYLLKVLTYLPNFVVLLCFFED